MFLLQNLPLGLHLESGWHHTHRVFRMDFYVLMILSPFSCVNIQHNFLKEILDIKSMGSIEESKYYRHFICLLI